MNISNCARCGREFEVVNRLHKFCSYSCRRPKIPLIYRFVYPDGRSYVGSAADGRYRGGHFGRSNERLQVAFEQYPPKTWTYEVLEWLPPGCSERERRVAEQRHIIALQSWKPEFGFNADLPAGTDFLSRAALESLPKTDG
jgi:hypothetical protein